jgi:hypothetical protein
MDNDQYIQHIKRLIVKTGDSKNISGAYAAICQFLHTYDGPKSQFLESIKEYNPRGIDHKYAAGQINKIMQSYLGYVEAGLLQDVSPERRAQLDVVSDFLEQAQRLLESKSVHPASAAVIIGAALEEFLRTWIENDEIFMGNKKPSIDSYSKSLREEKLITKQDAKDITSWAGLRNHAAHGEWEEVSDKSRISLMLEGVNLFMRKHGG